MQLWFWGWLVVAAAAGLLAAIARDRTAAPFALGAATAALIEAVSGRITLEWIAFVVVSAVAFVALNRHAYARRHSHDPRGRHSRGHARDDRTPND